MILSRGIAPSLIRRRGPGSGPAFVLCRCRGQVPRPIRPGPRVAVRGATAGPRISTQSLEDFGDDAGADRAAALANGEAQLLLHRDRRDRKSTRLNSSHV